MAGKFSRTGSFKFATSGTKSLFVIPKVDGTLAISNNSCKSFVLLLNGAETITVRPFGIARIGSLAGGFTTKVAIRTTGPSRGSFIFQQS